MKKFFITLTIILCFALCGCQSQPVQPGEVRAIVFGFGIITMQPKDGYAASVDTTGAGLLLSDQNKDIMVGKESKTIMMIPQMIINPPSVR